MEDKKQYEAFMEELKKLANNFRDVVTELGDILAKILPDVEIPDEEEDTWEMKCPYKYDDEYWLLFDDGDTDNSFWGDSLEDEKRFNVGNVFPTEEAAELEAKRRNLLTRFRSFRDECNGDWKIDWTNVRQNKYYVFYSQMNNHVWVSHQVLGNHFHIFGYFKNKKDCERAIELFGDEIKELFVEKRLANENN